MGDPFVSSPHKTDPLKPRFDDNSVISSRVESFCSVPLQPQLYLLGAPGFAWPNPVLRFSQTTCSRSFRLISFGLLWVCVSENKDRARSIAGPLARGYRTVWWLNPVGLDASGLWTPLHRTVEPLDSDSHHCCQIVLKQGLEDVFSFFPADMVRMALLV